MLQIDKELDENKKGEISKKKEFVPCGGDAGNDCRLSLVSRLGNVLILFLQTSSLKTKNLLKQAWQIFCF